MTAVTSAIKGQEIISNAQLKVAVCGLGLVGRTILAIFSSVFLTVFGIDLNNGVINEIKEKINNVNTDKAMDDWEIYRTLSKSTSMILKNEYDDELKDVDIWIICVDTPSVIKCSEMVSMFLKEGALVMISSTFNPLDYRLILKALSKNNKMKPNKDFFVAVTPERVEATNAIHNFLMIPHIIGAEDEETMMMVDEIYYDVGCKEDAFWCTPKEAAMVKVVENAYRAVNIVLANSVYDACNKYGIDFWRVRRLVNTCPNRELLSASLGAGGECLPLSLGIMSLIAPRQKRHSIFSISEKLNSERPALFANKIADKIKRVVGDDVKIGILGVAFKPNCSSLSNSFAMKVAMLIADHFREVYVHDSNIHNIPFVEDGNIFEFIEKVDVIVALTPHSYLCNLFDRIECPHIKAVIDPFDAFGSIPKELGPLKITV